MNNEEVEAIIEEIKKKKPPVFQGVETSSLKTILQTLYEFGEDHDIKDVIKYIKEK